MKKETFVKIINGIIEQDERNGKFNRLINELMEGKSFFDFNDTFQGVIIEALEGEFNDSFEMIEWWLYDLPRMGTNKKHSYVIVEDERVTIYDAGELYDYLMRCE